MWTRRQIYAGPILEDEHTYSDGGRRKKRRSTDREETREGQKALNERNSRKTLNRSVNANFKPGDLWITKTYREPAPTMKTALRRTKVFLGRLRRLYEELGLPPFKYIGVTTEGSEWDPHRIHHHYIIPYMPDAVDVLSSMWRWGTVKVEKVGDDCEHNWLAGYVFGNARGQRGKRWTQSRNLARPVVDKKEGVRPPRLDGGPKPRKGYVVIRHEVYAAQAGFTVYTMYKRVDGKPNKPRRRAARE